MTQGKLNNRAAKQLRRAKARRALMTRRNVLRASSGACLALPFLASLGGGREARAADGPVKRFLPIYFPNGASQHWWEGMDVAGTGDGWTLSKVLSPLQPIKHKAIHINNLGNYCAVQDNKMVEPSHARCTAGYLTSVNSDSYDYRNGVSVDQVLVDRMAFGTPIESMQVGCATFAGFFDGRPWHYNQCISWKKSNGSYPTEPLRRVVSPREVFEDLVPWATPSDPSSADPAAAKLRASVLDEFIEHSKSLKARLSKSDALVVEQYESRLREIEMLTEQMGNVDVIPGCEPVTDEPFHVPDSDEELQGVANQNGVDIDGFSYQREVHVDVMNALIVMAFQCDLTRVISYMLDDARTPFEYSHVTISDFGGTEGSLNYHDGAQHNADPLNNAYASISQWMVKKATDLALLLDTIEEGDGTMLDNTLMLFGCGMHSDDHDMAELPIVLIGGDDTLRHDQNVVLSPYPDDRQLRDLHYTILNDYFGADVDSFGDHLEGAPNSSIEEILA